MSTGPNDPIAAILAEAETNRRLDRAAAAAAVTVSRPAANGDYTVADNVDAGNPVTLDVNSKVPAGSLYPAGIGQTGVTFQHRQPNAAVEWTVRHGLNGYPNVVVRDSRGSQVIPELNFVDANTAVIRFGRPTAGTAELSL